MVDRRYIQEAQCAALVPDWRRVGRRVSRMRPNGLSLILGGETAEDAQISRGHEGCEESTGQLGGCQGSVVKSETKQRFASCLFRM